MCAITAGPSAAWGLVGRLLPASVHRGSDRDAHTRAQAKTDGDSPAADQDADRRPDARTDRDTNTDVRGFLNMCRVIRVLGHFRPL